MDAGPVLAAIAGRRSIRRFTDAHVAREQVRLILEAGRWAPSGLNNQPWRFLALFPGDPRVERLAAHTRYKDVIRGAGALIALFFHKPDGYNRFKDAQGLGACAQNMLLAAHAQGLGAVWLGQIINDEPEVTKDLGLDSGELELAAVIAVGHPDEPGEAERHPLDSLLLEAF